MIEEIGITLTMLTYAEALWDHTTMDEKELSFRVGDVISIRKMVDHDWWWGEANGCKGWFPASFVRESQQCDIDHGFTTKATVCWNRQTVVAKDRPSRCKRKIGKRMSHLASSLVMSKGTKAKIMQSNVIQEIIKAERNYTKQLDDIVEGYIGRCRLRKDMFTDECIRIMFCNIEEIHEFQKHFLRELEAAIDKDYMYKSDIAPVFLKNIHRFEVYSDYCSNHHAAIRKVSELLPIKRYCYFFEACRVLQNMIDIPIDGYLLTPVQKICKYPLQLSELLKYTDPEDPNYKSISQAFETMTRVTVNVNEHKRQLEGVENIALWQKSVINWQGEDILEKSTKLIHSGEVYMAHISDKSKVQQRVLFLFDRQLVICKKDYLRRDLHFKFRFDTANCEIADTLVAAIPAPWKYPWNIQLVSQGEVIACYSKDRRSKSEWFEAFQKERAESLDNSQPRVALSENAKRQIAHNVSDRVVRRSNSLKRYAPLRRSSSLKRSQTMKLTKSGNMRCDLNMTI